MSKWAHKNPGCVPTKKDVKKWVTEVNTKPFPSRAIYIANTPAKLPVSLAMVLTGGAYHEAFHTKLSCRRDLHTKEISEIVLKRWAQLKDWSKLCGPLLEWLNLIEDIICERWGREVYEGTWVKLNNLQDFILHQEAESFKKKKRKEEPASNTIAKVFRDLGLGYSTPKQKIALGEYQEINPDAFNMVVKGPLTKVLKRSMAPGRDTLEPLRLAMDVLITLGDLAGEGEQDQEQDTQDGEGGIEECPHCGDSGQLVVRPMSNGEGGKVEGKGVLTCLSCGFQQEVGIKKKEDSGEGGEPSEGGVKFEGFEKGEEEEKDGEQGEDGIGKEEQGEESPGNDESEEKGDGQSGEEGPKKGPKENPEEGEEPTDGKDESPSNFAGGYQYDPETIAGNDWSYLAEKVFSEIQTSPLNLLDASAALEKAFQDAWLKEHKTVLEGEGLWSPHDASLDMIKMVKPSEMGKDHDREQADHLIRSVKGESSFLRSRLRSVIKSFEMTTNRHGLPKGKGLSSKFIVDTKIALDQGQYPKKAFYRRGERLDTSMASVVLIDQSYSMKLKLEAATRILVALTEPLDALNYPTLAIGFRDGKQGVDLQEQLELSDNYHRYHGIIYDVFKGWEEKFYGIRWRFANTRAVGGTPMSDGLQFALDNILVRPEHHRFIFVATDGLPNAGHKSIIKRQIRLAKKEGVHIIGVGVGSSSSSVMTLFPDHVYDESIGPIPGKLIKKLNTLVEGKVLVGRR